MLRFKDFITVEYRPGEDELINYRAYRRKRLGEEVEAEALDVAGRLKRKRIMQRSKAKIKIGRERAKRRFASKEVLQRRAKKQARMMIFKKLTKDIPKSELTYQRRQDIEKRLDKPVMKSRINMIVRRLLPKVRKQEMERKRAAGSND
jgi:hypothetical protein